MLLYQAEKAVFVYGIGLESLKNAFPEVCWVFWRLAGAVWGRFFWFYCLFFRIELAFCAFIKSASSYWFLLCFLHIGRGVAWRVSVVALRLPLAVANRSVLSARAGVGWGQRRSMRVAFCLLVSFLQTLITLGYPCWSS